MRLTEQQYGHRYHAEYPYGQYICAYCGESASTADHVPPVATLHMLVSAGVNDLPPCITVPACRECNGLLGDAGAWSVEERRALARVRLLKRYASLLKMPDWSEEELADMGPTMARKIRGDLRQRNRTRERLAWMESPGGEEQGVA